MHTILVLNPKGGSGKSTLATNIAAYFALQGKVVTLADCDRQGSSRDWLALRPPGRPRIERALPHKGSLKIPEQTDCLIMDTPAGLDDAGLARFLRRAETLVIPVIASPIDIRAAERFIELLFALKGAVHNRLRIATVANRVREDTVIAARLEYCLENLRLPNGKKLPFIAMLRASQNYLRAAELGLSIFELAPSRTYYDREQWRPLLRWLSGRGGMAGG